MIHKSLLEPLVVYKPVYQKIRIGKDNDGGYVICNGLDYDCFLSGGVSDDCSFEEAFLEMYPDLQCFAFDGTISSVPETRANITFIRKNIGNGSDGTTNFSEYFEKYNDIFIKMDIEGHEFPWLASLNLEQMKKIKQLVIEFHYPYHDGENVILLNNIKRTHWLVHLHPNNKCEINHFTYEDDSGSVKNVSIPNVMELTYIRKEFLELSNDPVPSPIDQKNSPEVDDMCLSGYPYNCL